MKRNKVRPNGRRTRWLAISLRSFSVLSFCGRYSPSLERTLRFPLAKEKRRPTKETSSLRGAISPIFLGVYLSWSSGDLSRGTRGPSEDQERTPRNMHEKIMENTHTKKINARRKEIVHFLCGCFHLFVYFSHIFI